VSRAAVAFPGRGSIGPPSVGSLDAHHPWVGHADDLRRSIGLMALSELDARSFDADLHLRPTNAWPLTFMSSLLDAERIAGDHEVVAVVASSTGWYTALAASGALDFDGAFRIIAELAAAAEEPLEDGARAAELVYPLTDETWQPVPERAAALAAALDEAGGEVAMTVTLGSHAVLGGPADAVDEVAARLPPARATGREFPLRLAGDGWHTPLRTAAVARAAERLAAVARARPNVAMVDGAGRRHSPWSADADTLIDDAIGRQPTLTYDFATSLRVALREYAPDVVLLPGPGASLGAACAQVIVGDGYRGLRSREEFEKTQSGPSPILLSVRR
jgi:[acyl-carrier-protein] S-malonyltransferase